MCSLKGDLGVSICLDENSSEVFQAAIQKSGLIFTEKHLVPLLPSSDSPPDIKVYASGLRHILSIKVDEENTTDVQTTALEVVEQVNLYEKPISIELKIESKKDRTIGAVRIDTKAMATSHTFTSAVTLGYPKIFGFRGGYGHTRGTTATTGANTEDKECVSSSSSMTSKAEVPKGFLGILSALKIRRKHTENLKITIRVSGTVFCVASREGITRCQEPAVGDLFKQTSAENTSGSLMSLASLDGQNLIWCDEAERVWLEDVHQFKFVLKPLSADAIPKLQTENDMLKKALKEALDAVNNSHDAPKKDNEDSAKEDEEEIDPRSGGGDKMPISQMVRMMLTKLDFYFTLFPRIPVPIQKDMEVKFRERAQLYGKEDSRYGEKGNRSRSRSKERSRERRRRRSVRQDKNRDVRRDRDSSCKNAPEKERKRVAGRHYKCKHHLGHHHCRKHNQKCPSKAKNPEVVSEEKHVAENNGLDHQIQQ